MRACCPPGEGCNAPGTAQPCALTALRRTGDQEAEHALGLWHRYQDAAGQGSCRQRRFLRRAYARARDRALGLWTPWDASGLGTAR
jgi:hypothetical protein